MTAGAIQALDQDAFRFGSAFQQGQDRHNQSQIARLLGDGDTAGAIGVASQGDDPSQVMRLLGRQQEQKTQAREVETQQRQFSQAQSRELGGVMFQAATYLLELPPEQRAQAGQQIAEESRRRGLPMDPFDTEDLTDGALGGVVGQLGGVFGHAPEPDFKTGTVGGRAFRIDAADPNADPQFYDPGISAAAGADDARADRTYERGVFESDREFKAPDSRQGTVVMGPDGQLIYAQGSDAMINRQTNRADRTQLEGARDEAGDASAIAPILEEAQALLSGGLETGFGRDITGNAQRAYAGASDVLEAQTGNTLPGAEQADLRGAQFEQFNSISQELGARALSLFGGSDTERELIVAIRTNPGITYRPETNQRILQRKVRAILVLQNKPVILSEFQRTNPSGVTQDGRTWDQYWRDYQIATFGSDLEATNRQTGETVGAPETRVGGTPPPPGFVED